MIWVYDVQVRPMVDDHENMSAETKIYSLFLCYMNLLFRIS